MRIKKEILQKPAWVATIVACLFGMVVHLFGMVNCLHNYDDIAVQPYGYGTGVASGRWLLSYLGDGLEFCFGNHNIPLFNGIIFIILIAASAGLLVSVFEIKSRKMAGLMGMLFVVFPSATSVMFFTYTAVYYGIAIFLAVAAVWILPKYKLGGLLLSALFTAMSLGIYQAYMPLTVAAFVLVILRQVLVEELTFWKAFLRGAYACASIALGLLLYYLFLKGALLCYDTSLGDYQGVDSMGNIPLERIPGLILYAIRTFGSMPVEDYCNLAQTPLLCYSYIALEIVSVIILVYCMITRKKKLGSYIMMAFLCMAFPVAANLIVIMCPDSWIYTLMVYAFVMILWVPAILLETIPNGTGWTKYCKPITAKVVGVILTIVVISYAYLANVNYVSLYFANRQMENFVSGLVTQVRMTEGYDANKKWAMVGDVDDPLLKSAWSDEPIYGGNADIMHLINSYSRKKWIEAYLGYSLPLAWSSEIAEVKKTEEYKDMPYWPAEGSIRVFDNLVVIKFQD